MLKNRKPSFAVNLFGVHAKLLLFYFRGVQEFYFFLIFNLSKYAMLVA
jgi:hypothetical protein